MRTGTLAFMLGIIAVQFFSSLPSLAFASLPALIVIPVIVFSRYRRFLSGVLIFLCGFSWALAYGHWHLSNRIPAGLEGQDLRVTGVVSGLARHEQRISYFNLAVDRIHDGNTDESVDWLLRLKWYGNNRPELRPGQQWKLTVRLKRPYGLMNPGGFDYEKWLFSQGVSATGYVRTAEQVMLLGEGKSLAIWHEWRQAVIKRLSRSLQGHDMQAIVNALAVGDRSLMQPHHWDVLTKTGTNHLVAISGLHIGLVAGFVFFISRLLFSLSTQLCARQPANVYAACLSIIVAILYAALAGFSIPTQRALIMLVTVMLLMVSRIKLSPVDILLIAIVLVVLWDPLSVLSAGFWLSFTAVAVILFSVTGRDIDKPFYYQWGATQWSVSLGLAPLVIILFGRVSLVSPFVNILAVPWVSFVSVPLLMLSMPGLLLDSDWLLLRSADSLQVLWYLMEFAAELPLSSSFVADKPWWVYLLAFVAVGWLLLPRGMPVKWIALLCLVPLFAPVTPGLSKGDYRLYVLDVGQGQSIVVQTRRHTLVYDAGARLGDRFDMGSAVVLPVVRSLGVRTIDMLMLSHGDNDHSGGAQSILANHDVTSLLAGEQPSIDRDVIACHRGQRWQWDAVNFEVLHPPPNAPIESKPNNRSCVLRVSNGVHSVLLTGDIESKIERQLISDYGEQLSADILLAPHHGSKSSSSMAFIDAVSPEHVVFSMGYRNRFRFPAQQVVDRYTVRQIRQHRTDQTGMLSFSLPAQGQSSISSWRQRQRRYWHSE